MQPLQGFGIWIWELNRCDGGDLAAIAARCARTGVQWLAIKAGDSHSNGQVTKARVDTLRAAGIEVAAWFYSVPSTTDAQVQLATDLVHNQGIQHLIIDAEGEWEKPGVDWRPKAKDFAAKLRAAVGPDVYIADAPWPIINCHPSWPWAEFGGITNARMDQLYWRLAGVSSARFSERADNLWVHHPQWNRCPIGCNVDYTGAKHGTVDDLEEFLDHYKDCQALSIWSYQHLNADEWAMLERRHSDSQGQPLESDSSCTPR